MTCKIIKVALENSNFDGYITGIVTGGAKGHAISSATVQLEGFTTRTATRHEYNHITEKHEEVTKVIKTPIFWTDGGAPYPIGAEDNKYIIPKLDMRIVRMLLSPKRGLINNYNARRMSKFLRQDGIELLQVPSIFTKAHRKYFNGKQIEFTIIPKVPTYIHKVKNRLIDGQFLVSEGFAVELETFLKPKPKEDKNQLLLLKI